MTRPANQSQTAPARSSGRGRRGRPTVLRIAAIGGAIRAAALAVFLELGFEAASMDAIASRARVSKGTLYARYDSKELLFREVLEDELKRWSKRAGEQDHLLSQNLATRLRHHAATLIDVFEWPEYQRIVRLLDAATPALPDVARQWEEIGTRRYLEFLANDMAKTMRGAEIDWDFHAKLFLFSISGWFRAQNAAQAVNREDLLAFADGVISVIELAVRSVPHA